MRKFYNSIAIILAIIWVIGLYSAQFGIFNHLLLLPIITIIIYDIIGIAKLLNKG